MQKDPRDRIQWEIIVGMLGILFSVLFLHFNMTTRIDAQGQRLDAQGQRIDAMGQRIDGVHKEIMELIKKMK